MDYWHNRAARIGRLAHILAFLRYAWAQDAISHIWREGSAGKALAIVAMDLWGMGTGVGGMWRRCMEQGDGWLERRAADGAGYHRSGLVKDWAGGKYRNYVPSPYSQT